jgi:hypothetical protein
MNAATPSTFFRPSSISVRLRRRALVNGAAPRLRRSASIPDAENVDRSELDRLPIHTAVHGIIWCTVFNYVHLELSAGPRILVHVG